MENWVIDGYIREYVDKKWLEMADAIVFLNLNFWKCLSQAIGRAIKIAFRYVSGSYRGQTNLSSESEKYADYQVLPLHELGRRQIKKWIYDAKNWKRYQDIYMALGKEYPQKFIVLRSHKEICCFLEKALKQIAPKA